jgi:hypothetical protein
MTISNGSAVLAADLDAMLTSSLALILADDAQLPAGAELNLYFPRLQSATPTSVRRYSFVAPCDLLVECSYVQAADMAAASQLTVNVTGNGELGNWPLTVGPFSVGSGVSNGPRLLFDNTKGNPKNNFATTSQAFRVFRRGVTITITLTATGGAATSTVQVGLVFREFFQREG